MPFDWCNASRLQAANERKMLCLEYDESAKKGEEVKGRLVEDKQPNSENKKREYDFFCDDPRILCMSNRFLNVNLSKDFGNRERIIAAMVPPNMEEALEYLRERKYRETYIPMSEYKRISTNNLGLYKKIMVPD